MGMKASRKLSVLLLLFFVFAIANGRSTINSTADINPCIATIYFRTGEVPRYGTTSKISLLLGTAQDKYVKIDDVVKWGGLMGEKRNYFERNNLDIFSARIPCLNAPICTITLISDGRGLHPEWYCVFVKVVTSGYGQECFQHQFEVEQWLAADIYPYELTVEKSFCNKVEVFEGPSITRR